jgi:ribonuclease E
MLIDATHAEETRVVVLDGNRLEDFDIETATKRQLKGNIYLAKVVRVEPSLQAAFVEYGGNRHGFLAFGEIHPDYYQIPVADRQRLLELQAEEARLEDEEDDLEIALSHAAPAEISGAPADRSAPRVNGAREQFIDGEAAGETISDGRAANEPIGDAEAAGETMSDGRAAEAGGRSGDTRSTIDHPSGDWVPEDLNASSAAEESHAPGDKAPGPEGWSRANVPPLVAPPPASAEARATDALATDALATDALATADTSRSSSLPSGSEPSGLSGSVSADDSQPEAADDLDIFGTIPEEAPPETVGGDADNGDERPERRIPPRFLRNYHIQEVIHRRQILLVQVVKEERGTKGAALTTYLSLAGRFSVLMPNSPRGGGISRKITSAADRRRLKEIMTELDIPKGMGLIVRTAGAQRPKPEIRRDCEYLLRLWDDIRDHTLKSVAPALIYEEASLIKRAIRDVYSREVDDITVDGEAGWRAAHEFMRMLMPSHARKVVHWPDQGQSLFARFQVETQLDAMMQPTVQLRSGGYLVINQTEALVAIDVNSGRSTRERNVEETALRTNLEAADEVARQLRLRDLAGLIVIDFIDMESKRHNAMVERRLKEALKDDRARIQLGHISHFGLLEMSRQRLRPSLEETTLIVCPHCNGTGHVRGTESAALHVLRGVEEEAGKRRSAEIVVHVATAIALYILNHKRERLNETERRYGLRVLIAADDSLIAPRFRIERVRALAPGEEPRFVTPDAPRTALAAPLEPAGAEEIDDAEDDADDSDDAIAAESGADGPDGSSPEGVGAEDTEEAREAERRRRRRRRRRGGRDDKVRPQDGASQPIADAAAAAERPPAQRIEAQAGAPAEPVAAEGDQGAEAEGDPNARRRPRRGRRRRGESGDLSPLGVPGAEQPDLIPVYAGPTPADPFGGHAFDIFDAMEQAELNAAPARTAPSSRRGAQTNRSRWQPPAWAVPGFPPMLVTPVASDRPDRGPAPEAWALASRPFMLRRDRHTPRWARERGPLAAASEAATAELPLAGPNRAELPTRTELKQRLGAEAAVTAARPELLVQEASAPRPASDARAVPFEAGPPPRPAPMADAEATYHAAEPPATDIETLATEAPVPEARVLEPPAPSVQGDVREDVQAELPLDLAAPAPDEPVAAQDMPKAVDEAPPPAPANPIPANDIAPAPVVKPIVIGSESAPPIERKRGWWRRL